MTRILSREDIARSISMRDIIPVIEDVFREYATCGVIMPDKIYLGIPGYGDFRAMPSYVPSINTAGIKWVSVHPDNPKHGIPTVIGTILINKPDTGELLSVMDGTYITDMRTGAAGGVAAKHLARKNTSVIGLIGSGEQAWTQMLAYREIFGSRIKVVKVYSRTFSHSQKLADKISEQLGYTSIACKNIMETADSDIIATTTPSREPIVKAEWIKPGTHINAIGADAPGKQELENELTLSARVFADSIGQASHSGEINVLWSTGLISESGIAGTIGQVIAGIRPGRITDEEITIFDSTGLSIQDMAVAHIAYERAMMTGLGVDLRL